MKLRHTLFQFAFVFALIGCAPVTPIHFTSNRGADPIAMPRRLSIITDVETKLGYEFFLSFQSEVKNVLGECGTEVSFSSISPLELDPQLHLKRAVEFRADKILLVKQAGGTVDHYGRLIRAIYDVKLLALDGEKILWRASTEFSPGNRFDPVEKKENSFATALTNKLKSDGIYAACKAGAHAEMITAAPFISLPAQAWTIASPVGMRDQALDWIRAHSKADTAALAVGIGQAINESRQAVLLLGSGATRSGQCNILLLHADQMFAFEVDPAQTAGSACRSSSIELSSASPSGRVERMMDPIARIDHVVLDRASHKSSSERLTGTAKVTLLKSVQGRIGIRVTILEGKESKVMFRPIEMKVGVNDLVFDFPPLEMNDSVGAASGKSKKPVQDGPKPIAFDIVRDSGATGSEGIRSLSQLLSNSLALLVNVIHD